MTKKKHKKLVASLLLLIVIIIALVLYLNRGLFTQIKHNLEQRQALIKVQKEITFELNKYNQEYILLGQGTTNSYCYILYPLTESTLLKDLLRAGANTQKNLCGKVFYVPIQQEAELQSSMLNYIFSQPAYQRKELLEMWFKRANLPLANLPQNLQQLYQIQQDFNLSQYTFPIYIKYQPESHSVRWYIGERAERELLQFK
ncbi:hypothetical protein [Psittacicella gerlachiana]|uniref:Uncharacterized protein n=1 Tax=Psittacicella gerlachiana TaxID=2028574 RepID=A0A3A1YET1_9GAMM|nr:hypothetical protein [Psittacicella gerlachiana]RIY36743.1 hypothetical protein CKF59_02480 [Psittacicella gerlachiana]